ncbi:uncharacterized protein LOC125491008 [Plutella xylostella]|uniref:uncharacterized protein LOC125491008 n=1 Tax=Plutella xylostella TaxID=51655 RepID=UPI0020321AF7|nr:uncharacterized protein LOC125491008 [Plutella xylostella]
MSGPYAAGLGMRKRTISHVSTTDDEENEENFFSSNDAMPAPTKRRRVTHADAEVVPKFRPEDSNSSVSSWLHKIDQLGDVYGWDATEKQFVMQLRLRGSARRWYDELENYNLRWEDWKSALRTAFPRSTDYVDRLEAMLSRTKRDTETMTNYFHDKVSLLKKCEIEGESAISCIIRGLPVELRANAKAYQCETPELLYYGYLSSLENYRKVEAAASTKRSTWRRGATDVYVATSQPSGVKRCYACRRVGHDARDCRTQQRCDTCQRAGHTSTTCWFASAPSSSRAPVQQAPSRVSRIMFTTISTCQDIYKRLVYIGAIVLLAFIDTGSKLNILTSKRAKMLDLNVVPSDIVMRGFGGAHIKSLGRTRIDVSIDDICLSGEVEITDYDLSDIDLIIGQSMINQPGISLVTTTNTVEFVQTKEVENCLMNCKLEDNDFNSKYCVYLKCDVKIPAQSACYINVFVDIESNDNSCCFLTNSIYVHNGQMCYAIPGRVICIEGYLKFINLSDEVIFLPAHKLVARAELVSLVPDNFRDVMAVELHTKSTRNVPLLDPNEIDIGELSGEDNDKLLTLLSKYSHMFAKDTKDLGCTDLIKMQIQTTTDKPVHFKPYRLSLKTCTK